MSRRLALTLGVLAAACSPAPAPEPAETALPDVATREMLVACEPVERMPLEGRASPYDSATVDLGGLEAKLCYGRPSAKGREIFGGLVPYDALWRTGANEPTTLHLPFAATIGDLRVEPGSYSIYTVPGREEWTVVVNRSIDQWGHESRYTEEVRAQEVGRFQVPALPADDFVETFTARFEPAGTAAADLVLEWENTRVRIPVQRG